MRYLLLLFLVTFALPLSIAAETYTVHLYAPKVGNPGYWTMKAHVKGKDASSNTIDRTDWADNELLECGGKIQIGNEEYAYYKYQFDWDYEPTEICFNLANSKVGKDYHEYTSAYQSFQDGALYNFDAEVGTEPTLLADGSYLIDDYPGTNHTIYFADVLNWGAKNVRVHGWGLNEDITLWDKNEYVEDTGKYVKIGDRYYPLYKYDFIYYGEMTGIIFRNATLNSANIVYPGNDKIVYFVGDRNYVSSIDYHGTPLYSSSEHTVYFADKYGWWCGNTRLSITGSNGNLALVTPTEMKKFVKIGESDADYYPVYKYDFQYVGDLNDITFHYREDKQPQLDSNPTEFVDNAVYHVTAPGNNRDLASITSEDFTILEPADVPESTHTVYYVDKGNIGADNIKVHTWNGYASVTEWKGNPSMQPYKSAMINGEIYPVYSYTFTMKGTPGKVIFRIDNGQTANLDYNEGNYYFADGTSVESVDFVETVQHTVYFADKYGWGNQDNTQLKVTIIGDNGDLTLQQTTAAKTYVNIGEDDSDYYPLFKYSFPYIGKPSTVKFHYRENGHPNEDTNPAAFVDNQIYYAESEGNGKDLVNYDATDVKQYAKAELPNAQHTVYFIDTAKKGATETMVYVWNSEGPVKEWSSSEAMQPYKYTEINGELYPVYSYTFTMQGAPAKIIFRQDSHQYQSANLDYHEGYYYFREDGSSQPEIEFADIPTYTVYFADKYNWGAANTGVHLWRKQEDNSTIQYTAWDKDPKITDTETFVKLDDDYYRLFKFEIQWETVPNQIIFKHYNDRGEIDLQTSDDNYVDGKVYVYNPKVGNDWQPASVIDLGQQYTLDELPDNEYTIYFLDKAYLGVENVKPHIWGNTGDVCPWLDFDEIPGMEEYGRTTIDDQKYKVYKYSFTYKGVITGLILRYRAWNTGDLQFVNGGYYTYESACLTDVEVAPIPTYTVYFADKYNWGAESTFVHVYGNEGNTVRVLTPWAANEHTTDTGKYVEVDNWAYPLYSYTFRWDYLCEPEQIIFHAVNPDREAYSTTFENGKVYAYSGVHKDPSNPTLVYDLGGQLTYDEVFDKYGTTLRYADTGRWGASHTGVHLYTEGTIDENGVRHNTPEFEWGNDPRMTETGKWVRINDVWAPVYEYKTLFKDAWGMNFHAFDDPDENGNVSSLSTQTGDCVLQSDMMYYFAGYNISVKGKPLSELTLYDKIPEEGEEGYVKEGRWIYCHLGANQKYQVGYWKEPHAHFVNRPCDVTLLKTHRWYEDQLPDWRKEDEAAAYEADKMIPVENMPTVYKIWCDDINKVNEVVFYHFVEARNHTSSNKYEYYLEHPYENAEHPISIDTSISCENDPTTWASNAFTVGTHCMNQSYLTTQEYLDSWTANPDALYVIGNNGLIPTFGDDENYCNPRDGFGVESSEGVYIIPVGNISADKAVKFKFSLYDVKTISDTKCSEQGLSYGGNRGWATYNMGVLGHDFPGDDLDSDWYHLHIWESPGKSREVHTFVNQTVRFNNYNQYGWRIEAGRGGVVAGQPYWIVVDMHPDNENHRSVTLVPFDPQPTMQIKSGEITRRRINVEQAKMLHEPNLMKGSAANGPVYFDEVNVYSVKAQLDEVGTDLFNEQWVTVEVLDQKYLDEETQKWVYPFHTEQRWLQPLDVEYYVYLIYTDANGDEQKIAVDKLVGAQADGVLDITNLVYSPDVKYALRAVYHDNIQDRHFCSRFMEITTSPVVPDLYAPAVDNVVGTIYNYDGKLIGEEGVQAIGGAASFYYPKVVDNENNPLPYAYFPDLHLTDVVVNGVATTANASLIHSDHHIAPKFGDYLCVSEGGEDLLWAPYDEADEYTPENNWSNFILKANNTPVFIDRFDTTGVGSKTTNAEATFQFAAVYPFLVHDISKEATAEPLLSRRADDENEVAEDLGAYTVFSVRKATNASASFEGTVIVSAVDNVAVDADQTEATVEYYSISGQRLATQPTAPGVYIRRCGTKAEKVIFK